MIQPAVHVVRLGPAQMVINGIPPPDQLNESFLVVGLAVIGNIIEAFAYLQREVERTCQQTGKKKKSQNFSPEWKYEAGCNHKGGKRK
jgi:hypothetical protein